MKIAICVYDLYNGGAERVASLWANGFVKRGDEVCLVACAKDPRMSYPLNPDIKVFNIWSEGKSGIRFFRKILNLRRIMRQNRPNIALAVLNPFDLILPLSTVGLGITCINTEHNSFERPDSIPMTAGVRFRKFHLNKLFKAITVLTQSDKKVIANHLRKVFVLPNPVTFESLDAIPEKKKVVLAAGRLDNWYVKGFDVLIDAWGKIQRNHPDWELQIAGRGKKEDEQFLKERAISNGIQDGFRLLGYCDNIEEKYKSSAIFAFPSRCDGFGMVLTEAMSRGCACVSCDYNGRQAEIITNENEGILVPTDDVDVFADSLDRLMSDQKLLETLQNGALRRAKDFSIDGIVDQWYNIFKELGVV